MVGCFASRKLIAILAASASVRGKSVCVCPLDCLSACVLARLPVVLSGSVYLMAVARLYDHLCARMRMLA
eukprot:3555585-Alexandrium_andersonii.AAC.1